MMMSKLDFPLSGSSVNIVKQCAGALSDIIDVKFGCVVTFDGVDFETGASSAHWRKPPIKPEKRCEFMLPGGVKVSVWKADLTNFPQADAVVNAANERLQHYGGLAKALSAAGGPQIQRECDDLIRKFGSLETGGAVASGAGNLPCKFIIHAVGPDLPMQPHPIEVQRAKPQLEKAIRSIFCTAEAQKATNVAIPAISSGLFHYPMPDCADTIVSTVKHIYESNSPQRNLPREVFFVNNDEPTVGEMVQACRRILSPHQSTTYSQAVSGYTWGASSPSSSPVQMQFGSVLLTLKKDKIEEQDTDVIVNTASSQRDLNVGQISTAILHKAGHKMQDEVRNANKKDRYQYITCTKSYKLRCKEVFHTFCTEKWGDPAAHSVFSNSVLECLRTAAERKHKSISFPAIGTGALGFSKTESASIMLNAVAHFAQSCNKLDVFFVIFPFDHETFQAFQAQMALYQQHPNFSPANDFQAAGGQPWQQSTSHHSSTPAVEALVNRTSKPQISLCGPSEESTREAEKWLSVLLNEPRLPIRIVNNFLLHFSEQDHQKLSLFHQKEVDIEEFVIQGHACLTLGGKSKEDAVVAALKVEEMLCKVQKEFVLEEKGLLKQLSDMEVSSERQTVGLSDPKFTERKRAFKYQGLWVVKVDRVDNPSLQVLFDLKKRQLGCSTSQRMFQRIPAQFCEMISHVGFHAECAPPEDPKYGQGIYFAGTVKKALELWKENHEEFLYFVEAEVLTGKSVLGKPVLILPPPTGQDPNDTYDSVDGGPDVSVIFSGYQALPKHIFVCRKATSV